MSLHEYRKNLLQYGLLYLLLLKSFVIPCRHLHFHIDVKMFLLLLFLLFQYIFSCNITSTGCPLINTALTREHVAVRVVLGLVTHADITPDEDWIFKYDVVCSQINCMIII